MKNYPTHTLFAVVQGDEQDKADWTPIGVAFTNKDGSLSILFDEGKIAPEGARLILRKRKAKAAQSAESNQGGGQ
jgi:hypothetical protein